MPSSFAVCNDSYKPFGQLINSKNATALGRTRITRRTADRTEQCNAVAVHADAFVDRMEKGFVQ